MPIFDYKNRSHITITNILEDIRYEDYSKDLGKLNSESFKENLQIKSNVMQLMLYLDIEYN